MCIRDRGVGGALLTGNSVGDWWNGRPTSGTDLLGTFNRGQAASEARRRNALAEQAVADMLRGYDVMGNRIGGSPRRSTGGSGGGNRGASTARKAAAAAQKAENERLRQIREDAANQRELASLNDDILVARAALATASDDILRFELQQIDDERAQRLAQYQTCLLYTSPSPRDRTRSRMPSSA